LAVDGSRLNDLNEAQSRPSVFGKAPYRPPSEMRLISETEVIYQNSGHCAGSLRHLKTA
jgi:hypothetical protein